MKNTTYPWFWRIALGVLTVVLLAACGRGGDSDAAATPRVVPTMPAAQFAMPTSMITPQAATGAASAATAAVTAEVTGEATAEATGEVAATETVAEAATPPPAPTVDLTRGATVYTNRGCAECHGDQGQGVADKGSAIAGTPLIEADFTDIMRTGRDIGPDHIYGPSAISPGGMTALHAWLQSLGQ